MDEPLVLDGRKALGRPLSSVGGKAAALARLAEAGLAVPEFAVVTSAAFREHLRLNAIGWCDEPAQVRELIVEGDLPAAITDGLAGLPPRVAVRSSGAAEDSAGSSFAGQFSSFLSIDRNAAGDAIKSCWASYLSDRSISYRAERGIPLGDAPEFAVVVQRQIFSIASGVLFTVHPLDPACAYLEANFGTGESVVGSLAVPDGVTISRSTGRVTETHIGSKRRMTTVGPDFPGSRLEEVDPAKRALPVLTGPQAEEVYAAGRRIEEAMGCPQDVEWTFDEQGLWILQSRPITASAR